MGSSIDKLSVITVVYQDRRLSRALDSVLSQKVDCEIEVVVVSDETDDELNEILERYGDRIVVLRNPVRGGMYRARNQGLAVATGQIISFLNADDYYADDAVLADIVEAFRSEPVVELVYGNIHKVDRHGKVLITRVPKKPTMLNWYLGWLPPDPGIFYRRELFDRGHRYHECFEIAGDADLLFRLLARERVPFRWLRRTVAKMEKGGMSNCSVGQRLKMAREHRLVWQFNGLHPALCRLAPMLIVFFWVLSFADAVARSPFRNDPAPGTLRDGQGR